MPSTIIPLLPRGSGRSCCRGWRGASRWPGVVTGATWCRRRKCAVVAPSLNWHLRYLVPVPLGFFNFNIDTFEKPRDEWWKQRSYIIFLKYGIKMNSTLGVIKNETLVFVNFSAQDASILKISVPIIKRRSWGFQNTPDLQSLPNLLLMMGTEIFKFMHPRLRNWQKQESHS